MTTAKLVRVAGGVYRSETGSFRVFRRHWDRTHRGSPWVVVWEDFWGVEQQRWFATLAEAKEAINEGAS